jgi:SAM-dependent methyltransferase
MAVFVKRKRNDGTFDRGLVDSGPSGKSLIRTVHRLNELVGTALTARIALLANIKASSTCKCKTLAQQMDLWGVDGCQRNRVSIIAALMSNRRILIDALTGAFGIVAGMAVSLIPASVLQVGAEWLLDAAIEDVRTNPPQRPVKRAAKVPVKTVKKQTPTARTTQRSLGNLKKEQDRLHTLNQQSPPPQPDPFVGEPVLHFGAHLWPVKGNWQWHVDLWNHMPRLINGKCFVGVAISPETDDFATVRAALHPAIECREFVNTIEGENHTFRWLQEVVPQGQDDILIYCHGKGVRQHTAESEAVRRWSEAMYQTIVFNHDMIREKMAAGYTNCHSFRTFGTRPLSPKFRYHPSGTFFAVRAKHLAGKPVKPRYGGVEAWCGDHFPANEAWCEFYDNSMFTTLYDHAESRNVVAPMLLEWNRKQRYEMCSTWGRNFCRQLPEGSVKGKVVIEVGAYDVNGSCRPWIVQQLPASYLGTDMQAGPNVDLVCTGEELPERVGLESADLIICTEVLEHVEHWFQFVRSIWSVIRPGGILLLTTRSPGFPLHNYPADWWRFTVKDMLTIFEDQEILTITADPTSDPGVGVIVRKTCEDLTEVKAYSMQA